MSGLGETFAGIVTDGSLLVAVLVAALVGLISFASPCVLPLIPGYVAYVAGLAGASVQAEDVQAQAVQAPGKAQLTTTTTATVGSSTTTLTGTASASSAAGTTQPTVSRSRLLLGSCLFVLGFTVVFVAFGALFGGLGRLLLDWAPVLTRVMGGVTILMGLAFLGALPWLQRERRIHRRPAAGLAGAPLLGVVFGLGWTPCLGPTLGAVNTLAYSQASALRGAILGLAYCLGLGIPFVAVALGTQRALRMSAWARRHARRVMQAGGILLIVLGLLLITGLWDQLMIWLRAWLGATGLGNTKL